MPDLKESFIQSSPVAKLLQVGGSAIWKVVGPFVEHFLHPLYRTTSKSSFGKIWSSALLVTCMYYWWKLQKDIPETLEYMVQVLLLYVFSSKPVQIVRDHVAGKTTMSMTPDGTPTAGAPATAAKPAPRAPTPAPAAADDGEGA